jgi:uncharacterized cupredoxin-like copper-binding protein
MPLKSVLVALSFALMALIVACGGDGKAIDLAVTLREWEVKAGATEVDAARVTFVATNSGTRPHELIVVNTDAPPSELPFVEQLLDADKVIVAAESEPFGAGQTQRLTVKLSAGRYLLICNIVERVPGQPVLSHFEQGMVTSLNVRR